MAISKQPQFPLLFAKLQKPQNHYAVQITIIFLNYGFGQKISEG
jgi:hypothetical protein